MLVSSEQGRRHRGMWNATLPDFSSVY